MLHKGYSGPKGRLLLRLYFVIGCVVKSSVTLWGIQTLHKGHLICVPPFIYNRFTFESIFEDCGLLWNPAATVVFAWVEFWLSCFFNFTLTLLHTRTHTHRRSHWSSITPIQHYTFTMATARAGWWQAGLFSDTQWQWPCHNDGRDRKVGRTKSCHHLRVCGFVFQCGGPGTCGKYTIQTHSLKPDFQRPKN